VTSIVTDEVRYIVLSDLYCLLTCCAGCSSIAIKVEADKEGRATKGMSSGDCGYVIYLHFAWDDVYAPVYEELGIPFAAGSLCW
jgi:hypothetical protein